MKTQFELEERIEFLEQLIKENSLRMYGLGMYINKQYFTHINAISEYNKEISVLKLVLKNYYL